MCLEEMKERLRHRIINPELVYLQEMKEKHCEKRVEADKHMKSEPWTLNQLEKVLKSLKNGKSRDPDRLCNELFQSGVAGEDLKCSILDMLNKSKETLYIPEIMTKSECYNDTKARNVRHP